MIILPSVRWNFVTPAYDVQLMPMSLPLNCHCTLLLLCKSMYTVPPEITADQGIFAGKIFRL